MHRDLLKRADETAEDIQIAKKKKHIVSDDILRAIELADVLIKDAQKRTQERNAPLQVRKINKLIE